MMLKKFAILSFATVVSLTSQVPAIAQVWNYKSPSTKITGIRTYNDPRFEGDTAIWVENTTSECYGYWISGNSYSPNLMRQLSDAKNFGNNVSFYANKDSIWEGSKSKFCELQSIGY